MKFTAEELRELASPNGGKFSVSDRKEAFDFCTSLAREHYENFPVASFLVPKKDRPYIHAVYAFARIADDIADEPHEMEKEERIHLLGIMNGQLKEKPLDNPVFIALKESMHTKSYPNEPFEKLITAFMMDADFHQPADLNELLYYCSHSANPVGELVLRTFGEYNRDNARLSDLICSGLQLANFWQDISIDIQRERYYIPKSVLEKYGLNNRFLKSGLVSHNLLDCLKELYQLTIGMLNEGSELVKKIKNPRLRFEIKATVKGGLKIVKKSKALNTEILKKRPEITKGEFLGIIIKSLL